MRGVAAADRFDRVAGKAGVLGRDAVREGDAADAGDGAGARARQFVQTLVAGRADSLAAGVEEAGEVLDNGLANALLDCWIAFR